MEKIELFYANGSPSVRFRWSEPPRILVGDNTEFAGDMFREFLNEEDDCLADYPEGGTGPLGFGYVDFDFVAGDPDRIALFEITPKGQAADEKPPARMQETVDLNIVINQFRIHAISEQKLLNYLSNFVNHESQKELLKSLQALATVANIYKMLPNSSLALSVTSHSLYQMPWVPERPMSKLAGFSAFPMTIGRTFACIALFESGSCRVSPDSLGSVMAMATGDSIYIAAGLLCDPIETPLPHEIRRIQGNIGKPGIAMLIPPKEIQNVHADSDWRVVNHNSFNGKIEDSFQSTSLHLRFTDYILPIDIGTHGVRDLEIYFLESVVSVHDHGQWIADLDILDGLGSPWLHRIPSDQCEHSSISNSSDEVIENPNSTMIDDWSEILDWPNKASIVR